MGSERCAESETGRALKDFIEKKGKTMSMKHCTAVALAGGQGRRMGTDIQKQYLESMENHFFIILFVYLKSLKLSMMLCWW